MLWYQCRESYNQETDTMWGERGDRGEKEGEREKERERERKREKDRKGWERDSKI